MLDIGSTGVHISNQSEIYRLRPQARNRINAFYMTSCFVGRRPSAPPWPPSSTTAGAGPAALLGVLVAVAAVARSATDRERPLARETRSASAATPLNRRGSCMRFIDAHLHTDMIEDAQFQKLVMIGIEAAVIPSRHMFVGTHDADTVLLLSDAFLQP